MKIDLKKISAFLWPIERNELPLFLSMAFMIFCILFGFCSIRSIKDALVVPMIGSQAISFLKLWMVLPACVLMSILYVRLSNMMSFEYVFYTIVSSFLVFFFIFTFIIYPSKEAYHPDPVWIEQMASLYPNFQWFIRISGKWSFALFYLAAELWSVVLLNLLFWQFANQIFDSSSAKRFYPMLAMIGNLGLIAAGSMLSFLTDRSSNASSDIPVDVLFGDLLKVSMGIVIFFGVSLLVTFYLVSSFAKSDAAKGQVSKNAKSKTKTNLPLWDSIVLVWNSKYIGHLVMLTICYGVAINILEGPWKDKLGQMYPNSNDYLNFMGSFNFYMGVFCLFFALVGGHIVRSFSWFVAALSTPIMVSGTGLLFFIFVIISRGNTAGAVSLDASIFFNPLYMAVIVGAVQNILSKATKYSLFDSSKEMAYIPLSAELRAKGKAAVEVIGMKFGKSSGSFMQSIIFMIFPAATFDSISFFLFGIFLVITVLWFWHVFGLNREYKAIMEEREKEEAEAAASEAAGSESSKA